MIKNKVKNFISNIEIEEGFVVENPYNIKYLIHCDVECGVLLLTSKGGYLFLDSRFILDFNNNLDDVELILIEDFRKQFRDIIRINKVKKLVLETDYLTIERYKRYVEIVTNVKIDIEDKRLNQKLIYQRSVKDEEEIEQIKIAQELTDEAFNHILQFIKPGLTEKAIAIELEKKLLLLGSEGKPFEFIVVSGERTAIPHGKPTLRQVKVGDLITLDFGAKIGGYCSDMTRTISLGRINTKYKEVYSAVLEAQYKAIQSLIPGVEGGKVDKIVRTYLNKKNYGKYFTHGLGHGVGLSVHEAPRLTINSKDVVLESSVVTIEPGVYIGQEFGIRIEDMVVVKSNEVINLTNSSKKIICL